MMTGSKLLEVVERLPVPTEKSAPLTTKLERDLDVGPGRGRATYLDQRHHWTRWLIEYQLPGRPAVSIYNSINCPTMLFWLAEALEVERSLLERAVSAVMSSRQNQISQTATIRRILPWQTIEVLIANRV